jgi:hypothetical protein
MAGQTAGESCARAALQPLPDFLQFHYPLAGSIFSQGERKKKKEYSASGCPTTPAPLRSAPMGAAGLPALVSEPSSLLPSRQAYFCFVCFTSSRSIFLLVFFSFLF